MNKFSRYIKEGMRAKNSKIYKMEPLINPFFDKLSQNTYTKNLDLQFHFEIRIDTKNDEWGDEEGASNVKLFLKKGFIGASITLKDEKISSQEDLNMYLKQYFNDALNMIIIRLKKAKIEVEDEKLISDFNQYFNVYFNKHTQEV
ncbi:MAG: hypothetical protein KGV59_00910 [Tenacibaculum sp.]|nr:hypothetical protein [Tenacibaculum sp.]